MTRLRAFFLRHRAMAFAVVALALAMKALVPAGYMIGAEAKVLSVRVCEEALGASASVHDHTRDIVIPMKGDHSPKHDAKHDGVDGVCPFSALSLASLGGADPIQLALALLFILATGFAAVKAQVPARASHLRPPLRGPPALV